MTADRRVVCWFSCGVTSAVASKMALAEYGSERTHVVYCDTRSEHPDNHRFLRDCEQWYGHQIEIIGSDEYHDIWDVFEKTRWIVGVNGARCTAELKKRVRRAYERPDDLQVFGFDASEEARAKRFREQNIEVNLLTPLIDCGLSKADCGQIVMRAGIELPMMYRLGYRNSNCVGCPKGQQGYWNKIRRDFPSVFARMARTEREIGAAINKSYAGDGKRKKVFLDELDPDAGNYNSEPSLECGLLCAIEEDEEANR